MQNQIKPQNTILHFLKRIGYLVLILNISTWVFQSIWKDDNSGSIIGDSSDWKVIIINTTIIVLYAIFLIIDTVALFNDKRTKLAKVNLGILFIILVIIGIGVLSP